MEGGSKSHDMRRISVRVEALVYLCIRHEQMLPAIRFASAG